MAELTPILQTATRPVILISGVGLLILSMTNRLGRVIDRGRLIASSLPKEEGEGRQPLEAKLRILWGRAHVLRAAFGLAAASALAASLLAVLIFVTALAGLEPGWLVVSLFTICLISLIVSLDLFTHDLNQSLAALKLELDVRGSRSG